MHQSAVTGTARARPVRVAFVSVGAQMSGVEFSTLYLSQALDRARFEPLIICPTEGELGKQCRAASLEVRVLPQPRPMASSFRAVGRVWPNPLAWLVNGPMFAVMARRLAACLRSCGAGLVVTKGLYAHFYGGLAARWARLPCVWHVQDLVSERAGSLYPAVLGWAGRALATQVIADGGPIVEQLAPYLPPSRLIVAHNGVDTKRFSPEVDGTAVRAEWGLAHTDVLVGNVARLTPWKGQDHLLRAFAEAAAHFPTARLVFVGTPVFDDDKFERELRLTVDDLRLRDRVIFAGYRWDLPEVLAAIDLFVHAAIEKDTSPLAVVSALATGKAVVSTSVPGVAEMLTPGVDAVLVPPADATALAQALRSLLADPAERHRLGREARDTAVRRLSLPAHAERCQAVFSQALEPA